MVQKAVKVYLDLTRKKNLAELMKAGYLEMVQEGRVIMKQFENADRESLRHVD